MPEQSTILIIENDQALVVALRDALSSNGFRVLTAATGEKGLAAAREHQPDLITLDLMLGELTGIDVLRALRKDGGWGERVPVIILTSVAYLKNMDEAKQLANKIISKTDFEIPALVDTINSLLTTAASAALPPAP